MQKWLKISIFIIIAGTVLTSCKKRKICAAYNSFFVYNETNIIPYFLPFGSDTMPSGEKSDRFDLRGLIKKDGRRDDSKLLKYNGKDFKENEVQLADSNEMMNHNDSMGSIIHIKELFPEKVNTDQSAYDHYVGELLKKYQDDTKKGQKKDGSFNPVDEEFDSTAYWNNPPDMLTKEEQKQWKKDKKAYKKRKKQRDKERKQKEKENALNEEEDGTFEDDEEFDFDLDDEE